MRATTTSPPGQQLKLINHPLRTWDVMIVFQLLVMISFICHFTASRSRKIHFSTKIKLIVHLFVLECALLQHFCNKRLYKSHSQYSLSNYVSVVFNEYQNSRYCTWSPLENLPYSYQVSFPRILEYPNEIFEDRTQISVLCIIHTLCK